IRSKNFRRDQDVHSDIEEGELRVDQRIDADAADAGLEAAGSVGYFVADIELHFKTIHRADLRRLQDFAVGVIEQRIEQAARKRQRKIARADFADVGKRNGKSLGGGGWRREGRRGTATACVRGRGGGRRTGGVNTIGVLIPFGATAAARSRSSVRFTCNTRISMSTSDLGLSRSATSFSAKATLSASPRTIMAFCAWYVKIF